MYRKEDIFYIVAVMYEWKGYYSSHGRLSQAWEEVKEQLPSSALSDEEPPLYIRIKIMGIDDFDYSWELNDRLAVEETKNCTLIDNGHLLV